jgi:hypothetical protein
MLPDKVDVDPLVAKLQAKTKAGKIAWQPTAEENAFIAAVGTGRFRIRKIDLAEDWEREPNVVPVLDLFDEEGKLVWSIRSSQVSGGLFGLYELAQRIGNRVDERVHDMISALDELD